MKDVTVALHPSVLTGNFGNGGFGPPNAIHNDNDKPTTNPVSAP